MKRYHVPSLLLGFGLGLLITALTGVVFFSGADVRLTDEEIMMRAAALGMSHTGEAGLYHVQTNGGSRLELSGEERVSALAQRLAKAGILEASLEFEILARQEALQDPPEKGVYLLPPDCTAKQLVSVLKKGPETAP